MSSNFILQMDDIAAVAIGFTPNDNKKDISESSCEYHIIYV